MYSVFIHLRVVVELSLVPITLYFVMFVRLAKRQRRWAVDWTSHAISRHRGYYVGVDRASVFRPI